MVRALAEAMVWGRRIEATTMRRVWLRSRRFGSTAQHPPRRTQDQKQATAKDEKVDGHGVLSLKETFK